MAPRRRRYVTMLNHMVEGSALDEVYRALADGSRRAIVWRLAAEGELKVTELARPFDVSLNAVSKHIKVLERAGLVERTIRGREHRLKLRPEALRDAAKWLEHYRAFWEKRLDALEELLVKKK